MSDIDEPTGSWTPEVGDRQLVLLETDDNGAPSIITPDVTRPVDFRSVPDCPADTRLKTIVEVVDTAGLTGVVVDIVELLGRLDSGRDNEGPTRWELVEDIRRVAADVGRSPTLDHIASHGSYDPEEYSDEFDSYLIALEEAGIEPTQSQYNFADYEPPQDHRGTANVRYLREHGPTPTSELPTDTGQSDKQHGAARFGIQQGVAGNPDSVYYLLNEHEEREVIQTFFEANPKVFQNTPRRALVMSAGNHSHAFRDAMRTILDESPDRLPDKE
jgi:hypothetical protein